MAWLSVLTICILILDASLVLGSPSVTDDGASDTEMREIRLLLHKYGAQIESLERENVRLEEKTLTLEEKVLTLEEQVLTLEEKTVTLEDKVMTLEDQFKPKTDDSGNPKPDPDEPGIPDGSASSDGKTRPARRHPDGSVKKINTRVASSTDSGVIAFHAILTYIVSDPAQGHIVPFDKIVTNIGAHFSSTTGVFTCAKVGVYQFSWMMKVYNNQWLTTELVRNGAVLGSAMSGDDTYWTTGAATVITMLTPGDEVWVRVASDHNSGADIHPTFTMFNGFLIH